MQNELRVLSDISEIMGSSLDLNYVFDRVMRVLVAELGIETGRLVIHDDVTEQLVVQVAHGLTPEQQSRAVYAIGEGITGQVYETGKARVVPDVRKDPDYLDRAANRKERDVPYSFICLPIRSDRETVGAMGVDKRFVDDATLEKDVHLLTIVAALISQAVRIHWMVRRENAGLMDQLEEMKKAMHDRYRFSNIIGSSPAMLEVFGTIDQVARTRATVLLMGETGTGKEMIAKAIHFNSDRKDKPFIRVNCGALSGQLLESELFGHVKGAFTGAIRDKMGRFEAANHGTLFLDEIATLDMPLQVKLLRVLQEGEFERVGDHHTIKTDVRIIAAANVDLEEECREKRFRDDLYYRLNVVAIRLPPLRERRQDLPILIDHFLDKYNKENARCLKLMSRDLMNLLLKYHWPGNVRELENVIERAVVLSSGEDFTEDLLPLSIRAMDTPTRATLGTTSPEQLIRQAVVQAIVDGELDPERSVWSRVTDTAERVMIEEALGRCENVKIKAADYLGINRNTLNKKYNELGIQASRVNRAPA